MKRLFVLCVLAFCLASNAIAQNKMVQITSTNITDAGGNLLQHGTITFLPTDAAGNPILAEMGNATGMLPAGQILPRPVTAYISNGAITTTTTGASELEVADTSATFPTNLCYAVTIKDTVHGTTFPSYKCVQPATTNAWCSGGVCNWDIYQYPSNQLVQIQIGPQGPAGPPGPGLVPDGPWSNTTAYALGDLVTYSSVMYAAITANTGREPDTNPSYWMVVPNGLGGDATTINAQSNTAGAVMVPDGTTDNCAAFTTLQAAVPPGGALFIPPNATKYHVSISTCPFGLKPSRNDIRIYGVKARFVSGTGFVAGTVVDAPITANLKAGVTIDHITADLLGTGYDSCFTSGTAQVGTMNFTVHDTSCRGSSILGHAILAQSGTGNLIYNNEAYNIYHCGAIRSGHSVAYSNYCQDTTDFIVKSADPSGSVDSVLVKDTVNVGTHTDLFTLTSATIAGSNTIYNGTITGGASNAYAGLYFTVSGFDNVLDNGTFLCVGSTATTLLLSNSSGVNDTHAALANDYTGGGVFVTAESSDTITSNVDVEGVTCKYSVFCLVFKTSSSGQMYSITARGVVGDHVYGFVDAYDDGSGAIGDVAIDDAHATYVAGNAFQNSSASTTITLSNYFANGVSGQYMVGTFQAPRATGARFGTGNPNDADYFCNAGVAGQTTISCGSNYYAGSSLLGRSYHTYGATIAGGAPGIGFFGSTSFGSRDSQPMAQYGWLSNAGVLRMNTYDSIIPSGTPGIHLSPASDADNGEFSIYTDNMARTAHNWSITKGGSASFQGIIQNSAGVALSGFMRAVNGACYNWRNNAGSADLPLCVSSTDQLTFPTTMFGSQTVTGESIVPDPVNPTDSVNLETMTGSGYLTPIGTVTPNSFASLDGGGHVSTPCGPNCGMDSAGNATFATVTAGSGSSAHYDQFSGFNSSDPGCGPSGKACIFPLSSTNDIYAEINGGTPYPFLSQSGIVLPPLSSDPTTLQTGLAYLNTTAGFPTVATSSSAMQRLVHTGLIGHFRPTGNNYIGAYFGQADVGSTATHALGIVIGDSTVSGFSSVNTSWVETVIAGSARPMLTERLQNRLISASNPSGFGGAGWGSIAAANNLEPTGLSINTGSATHLTVTSHNGTSTLCPDDQVGEDDTVNDIVTWTASKTTLLTFYALEQVNGGSFDISIDGLSYTGSPQSTAGGSYGAGLVSKNSGALTEGSHTISVKVTALGTGSKGVAYCGVRSQDTTTSNTFEMQKWGRASAELQTWNAVPQAVLTALSIDPAFVAIESGINERQNNDRTLAQIQSDFHAAKTTINTVWPNAAVIYVSPHKTNDSLCSGGTCNYTTAQVAAAIRDQANADSVPLLNFYDYTSSATQVADWGPCPYAGASGPTCAGVHFNDVGNAWLAEIACNILTDFNCPSGAAAPSYGWNQTTQTPPYTVLPGDFSGPTNTGKWFEAQTLASPTYTLPSTPPPVVGNLDPCIRVSNIGTGVITINSSGVGIDGVATSTTAMTLANGNFVEICSSGSTYKSFGTTSRNAGGSYITAVSAPLVVSAGLGTLQDARGAAVTNVPNQFLEGDTTITFSSTTSDVTQTIETPSANTLYHCDLVMSQTTADAGCSTHGVVGVQLSWTDALSSQAITGNNNVGWRTANQTSWTTAASASETAAATLSSSTTYTGINTPVAYEASGSAISYVIHVATQAAGCSTYPVFKVHYKCTK